MIDSIKKDIKKLGIAISLFTLASWKEKIELIKDIVDYDSWFYADIK